MIDIRTKAIVFDIIMEHLENATHDKRKREQLRAMTALRKIRKWVENATVQQRTDI